MANLWAPLVLVLTLAVPVTASSRPAGSQSDERQRPAVQSERMRSAVRHFDRAFYELTPTRRAAEAAQEFDQAIAEFESELAAQPANAAAHEYLARIYNVRKDYGKAASHYDKVAEIEPLNVDACVFAAVAYTEGGQVAEARARLLAARARTSDPDVLTRLDGYIAKLDTLPKK